MDKVAEWLENDIVGCLQQFFMDCQTGDFLKDREVQQRTKLVIECFAVQFGK